MNFSADVLRLRFGDFDFCRTDRTESRPKRFMAIGWMENRDQKMESKGYSKKWFFRPFVVSQFVDSIVAVSLLNAVGSVWALVQNHGSSTSSLVLSSNDS